MEFRFFQCPRETKIIPKIGEEAEEREQLLVRVTGRLKKMRVRETRNQQLHVFLKKEKAADNTKLTLNT